MESIEKDTKHKKREEPSLVILFQRSRFSFLFFFVNDKAESSIGCLAQNGFGIICQGTLRPTSLQGCSLK